MKCRLVLLCLLIVCPLSSWAGPEVRDGGLEVPDGGTEDARPVLPPGLSVIAEDPLGPAPQGVLLEALNNGLALARRYVLLLLSGKTDQAQLMHDAEGARRPDLSPLLAALRAACGERCAPSDLVLMPVQQTAAETTNYFFVAHYPTGPEVYLRVSVDHAGHISGAAVGPQAVLPSRYQQYDRYDNYRPRATLSLPFRGEWDTINASPGPDNGHFLNANQRFAVDWFIIRGEGKKAHTYRGKGHDDVDYYAYGKEVLAPAPGKVVQVVDGVPDNVPGRVNVYFRLGNMVVLDLGHHEFAYLCHLKPGSIKVQPGDVVKRGQVLAGCGNSGNSTEPHLHFQLADGPLITSAASLPAVIAKGIRNGAPASHFVPLTGDRLSP